MTTSVDRPAGASEDAPDVPPGVSAQLEPAGPPAPAPAPARKRRPFGRHPYRLLVVFALLVGAIAFLLVEGLGSSLDYYDTVGQAVARKAQIGTSTIRLMGSVVRGSIVHTGDGANFEVSGGGHQVPVHEVGSPPQLFQPGIPVVVVGHFSSAGSDLFMSNQIMVKHSATYVAKKRH